MKSMLVWTPMLRTYLIGSATALLLGVTVVTGTYLGMQTERRFHDIATSWTGYAENADKKGAWISEIRGLLGYGGIIHNFKNYVLRQEPVYLDRLERQLHDFFETVQDYEGGGATPAERQALAEIRDTINDYKSRIPIAQRAAREQWPPQRTDADVRVDDTRAIAALQRLERTWRGDRHDATSEIVRAVDEGQALIAIGFGFLLGLAVVALALFGLLYLLLRELHLGVERLSVELIERKRAEQAEKKLSRAVEQSPATIIMTDTQGRIEYVNRRFEELTGYTRQEMMGQTPRILRSGDMSQEQYAGLRVQLERGEEWRGVFHNRKKDGGSYWAETTILPLKAEDGSIGNYIGIGEDITEKRKAREQVIKAQKMEAVGLLAGGVAHDFNNILTTILGAAHLARLDVASASEVAQEIEQIEIAAKRAQSLVGQLLTFARRQPARPRRLDLRAQVSEVFRLLRASLPASIALDFDTAGGPVGVIADPTHLHQIVMNLCRNAAEAIGGNGGRIVIEIAVPDHDRGSLPPLAGTSAEGWVRLTVGDNGPGMPEETARKVFDPFFTTKPIGKGTGLGLTVVATLIEEMGGHIVLDTHKDKGTTFTILLPRSLSYEESAVAEVCLAGGHESILLVDDEGDIVSTYRRLLMRLGYRVEAFTEPKLALAAFNTHPSRFDLVITDLVMPEMTGDVLAHEVWQRRRDCPVMICTGYRARDLERPAPGRRRIMDKPLDPPVFAAAVREMLDDGKAKPPRPSG